MTSDSSHTQDLVRRAGAGDQQALREVFTRYHQRLRRMVALRLDLRLQGRLDPSDVLQEAYAHVVKRLPVDGAKWAGSFFQWLRLITGQTLTDLHRRHLGAKMRDAGQEVALLRGALPPASSASLASQLLGRLTSASRAAIRAETKLRVEEALNGMDELDREVLVLRHFEMLSNDETAQALNISPKAASKRYVKALLRLKQVLTPLSDLGEHAEP